MSERPDPADALEVVRGLLRGDDRDHAAGTFMRGLTLGALIGAAVAGSAIWQRRGRPRSAPKPGAAPDRGP